MILCIIRQSAGRNHGEGSGSIKALIEEVYRGGGGMMRVVELTMGKEREKERRGYQRRTLLFSLGVLSFPVFDHGQA